MIKKNFLKILLYFLIIFNFSIVNSKKKNPRKRHYPDFFYGPGHYKCCKANRRPVCKTYFCPGMPCGCKNKPGKFKMCYHNDKKCY